MASFAPKSRCPARRNDTAGTAANTCSQSRCPAGRNVTDSGLSRRHACPATSMLPLRCFGRLGLLRATGRRIRTRWYPAWSRGVPYTSISGRLGCASVVSCFPAFFGFGVDYAQDIENSPKQTRSNAKTDPTTHHVSWPGAIRYKKPDSNSAHLLIRPPSDAVAKCCMATTRRAAPDARFTPPRKTDTSFNSRTRAQ